MESKLFNFEGRKSERLEQYADFSNLTNVFADGISQVFFEDSIAHILFYQKTGVRGDNAEICTAVLKLQIPSAELSNFYQNLQNTSEIEHKEQQKNSSESPVKEIQKEQLGPSIKF